MSSANTPNWSPEEKAFVEDLHFDGWSPSGIAAQIFEVFGTDRTREHVSALLRIRVGLELRRAIPRRQAVSQLFLAKPMREVVEKQSLPLVSEFTSARISQLWADGRSIEAIAETLFLPPLTVAAFVLRHCQPRNPKKEKPAKTLAALQACECRFPVAEQNGQTMFCAADVAVHAWKPGKINGMYCADHAAKMRQGPRVIEDAA